MKKGRVAGCRAHGIGTGARIPCVVAGRGAEKGDLPDIALSTQASGLVLGVWVDMPIFLEYLPLWWAWADFFSAKLSNACLPFFGVSAVCQPLLTLLCPSG